MRRLFAVLFVFLAGLFTTAADAQGPANPTPVVATSAAPAEPLAGAPSRGTVEVRIPIGVSSSFTGSLVSNSTEFNSGIELGYHLSRMTSILFGMAGRVEENFYGADAHVDIRYRFWDLSRIVKPYILGGIGHSWDFPRVAKSKNTVTAFNFRMGTGLDFALTNSVLWGLQLVAAPGFRILPDMTSYLNINFTAVWTFVL